MIQFRGQTRRERFILVADELSATTAAELPQDRLAGVVVRDGAAKLACGDYGARARYPRPSPGAKISTFGALHRRTLVVDGYRGELHWSILNRAYSGISAAH